MLPQQTHALNDAQHPNQSNGNGYLFVFVISAICIFFLKYCIENHVPTTGFINFLSLFFDSLRIEAKGSYLPEIVILILLSLAAFGLYVLITRLFLTALTFAALTACVIYFYSDIKPEHIKPLTLKDVMIQDGRAKESDNVGG